MVKWAVEFEGKEAQALQQCLHALGNLASSVFIAASLSMWSSSLNHQYTEGHNFLTCPVGSPWDLLALSFWWSHFHVYGMRWEHGHFKASEIDLQHRGAEGGQGNQHENVILTPWQEWEPSHKCLFRGRGMALLKKWNAGSILFFSLRSVKGGRVKKFTTCNSPSETYKMLQSCGNSKGF